MKASVTVK